MEMVTKFDLKELRTVPNMLSVLRIILIVPFVIFFLNKNYIAAAAMIILSGITPKAGKVLPIPLPV